MNVTSLLSRTILDFNFETLPHTVLVHCIIPALLIAEPACATITLCLYSLPILCLTWRHFHIIIAVSLLEILASFRDNTTMQCIATWHGIFSSWHMSLSLPWCDAAGGVVGLCCPIIIKVTVCHCLTLCSALAWPWRHNTLMAKNNKFFSVKISFNIVNTSTSVSVIILQQKQKQKLIAIFSILHLSKYQV